METELRKPIISILMAVYDPNPIWFKEQLRSLNAQDYPNIRLYVRDDCSPDFTVEDISSVIAECITAFPFTIKRNERNLGSNQTFERLTREAEGDCFAYCDQDDVWLPEKLTMLMDMMQKNGSLLVCSDARIIDGEGRKIADSITEIRKRHILHSGDDLAKGLLTHNFVIGCTTLVDAAAAKKSLPFCPDMIHDHYLALYCAANGRIDALPTPTICYRQHGNNQTGLMAGVKDKKSYGHIRIDESIRKFEWLQANLSCDAALSAAMERDLLWLHARQRYWREKHGALTLWRYRDCGRQITLFELFAAHMGERLFLFFIQLYRNNII